MLMINSYDFFELTERLGNLLRAEERSVASRYQLQPVHIHALQYLSRCNRFSNTARALTEFLGMTKGTVSQTIGVLERRGLVSKSLSLQDRRIVHIFLTIEGKTIIKEISKLFPWQSAYEQLNPNEIGQVEWTLKTLLNLMQKANNSKTFGVCHSCSHLLENQDEFCCGLTHEKLTDEEPNQICHEHKSRLKVLP